MLLLSFSTGFIALAAGAIGQERTAGAPIRVHEERSGHTREPVSLDYEWSPVDGGYRHGESFLTAESVAALRARARAPSREPNDVLRQLGVTSDSVESHRAEILDMVWPPAHRPPAGSELVLPTELTHLLTFDSVAPQVVGWFSGASSTRSLMTLLVRIELPGDPTIVLESDSFTGWKLPWTIRVGDEIRHVRDIDLSRAVQPLLTASGPNSRLIDGSEYWSQQFWRDESFWDVAVGWALDEALSRKAFTELEGYSKTIDRFEIQWLPTSDDPKVMRFDLKSRANPCVLDRVRWSLPMSRGKPAMTWLDFLALYDDAAECIETHAWLTLWKRAVDRTFELTAVGREGFTGAWQEAQVLPAWEHACFDGRPEFEIRMWLKDNTCGTVWLSRVEPRTLIQEAHWCEGTGGQHWFDWLDFSFSPWRPRYGIVDSAGKFEFGVIGQ